MPRRPAAADRDELPAAAHGYGGFVERELAAQLELVGVGAARERMLARARRVPRRRPTATGTASSDDFVERELEVPVERVGASPTRERVLA